MSTDVSPPEEFRHSKWPGRVVSLCASWKAAPTERERNRLLSELWPLVNTALTHYIRVHGSSHGHIDPEDARDIAAEKALVFLRGLETDLPDSPTPDPARACAYLSTLAHHGLIDALRSQGRKRAMERRMIQADPYSRTAVSDSAEITMQRSQFVEAIGGCVDVMTPRARSVWFMRAFLDLPSRKISLHPDVQMTSAGVDMLLSRTRRLLRDCMKAKGFDASDAPQGTFLALWEIMRRGSKSARRSDDHDP